MEDVVDCGVYDRCHWLLEHGAEVTSTALVNALHLGFRNGVYRLLLEHGAKVTDEALEFSLCYNGTEIPYVVRILG